MKKAILLSSVVVLFLSLQSCKSGTSEADWETRKTGSLGISVESPFEWKEQDMSKQLTPSVKKVIKEMETYVHDNKNEYYAINSVAYTDDVTVSIKAAVNGAINEMKMKAGGTVKDRKDEMKEINGHQASVTRAVFSSAKGEEMELQMAILNKGNLMYQVMGLYPVNNDDAKAIAERILNSIKID